MICPKCREDITEETFTDHLIDELDAILGSKLIREIKVTYPNNCGYVECNKQLDDWEEEQILELQGGLLNRIFCGSLHYIEAMLTPSEYIATKPEFIVKIDKTLYGNILDEIHNLFTEYEDKHQEKLTFEQKQVELNGCFAKVFHKVKEFYKEEN